VFQEREEFEQKVALELSNRKVDETEEELEELCRLASASLGYGTIPS
jgi:hypothetical protein